MTTIWIDETKSSSSTWSRDTRSAASTWLDDKQSSAIFIITDSGDNLVTNTGLYLVTLDGITWANETKTP
jgi:hypothetical protein